MTDAVVIAILTSWAYLLAYLFEYGYLSYFGIPSDFIDIGLISIIVALLWVSGFLLLFFVLGTFIIPFLFRRRKTHLGEKLSSWITMFLLVVFIPLLTGGYGHAMLAFGSLSGFLFAEIMEIFFFTKGASLNEKIANQDAKEAKRNRIFDWLAGKIGFGGISAIALFFVVSYLAFAIGSGNAVRKNIYPIISENGQELAVIVVRQNDAIALPFNREKGELIREVYVYNLEDLAKAGVGLKMEKTGKLKVAAMKK